MVILKKIGICHPLFEQNVNLLKSSGKGWTPVTGGQIVKRAKPENRYRHYHHHSIADDSPAY